MRSESGSVRPLAKPLLIVVETVYHQNPDDQPTSVESRFAQSLGSMEQPYGPRRLSVEEAWKPLDCGWVKEASALVLKNEEGTKYAVNPTLEERTEDERKTVEIGVEADGKITVFAVVPSGGKACRFQPVDLSCLRVRCRSGAARCSLTVFPR